MIPSWEDLQKHKEIIPEINPAAVIAMLRIKQAAEEIQQGVLDVLQSEHHLSEGKFCVLVVLHQHQTGIAPSVLAEKVGVTRATVSMERAAELGEPCIFVVVNAPTALIRLRWRAWRESVLHRNTRRKESVFSVHYKAVNMPHPSGCFLSRIFIWYYH